MQFGILGSLRVEVDGSEVRLTSPKHRLLVAALLAAAGEVVSAVRLAEILWGVDQPASPSRAVGTYVSRIRRLLFESGGEEARALLVTRPTGYALAVDSRRVDAWRFETMVDAARHASSPEQTETLTRDALALWRGEALSEFEHEQATAVAARLTELRCVAVELRADALFRLGRYQEAVTELEAAVVRDRLREQLQGQLMVALYRSGRQADALGVYRTLRRDLVEGLGVEPSTQLRRLENAILQQSDDLPWPAPPIGGDMPGVGGSKRKRIQSVAWPEELSGFVGREAELHGVAASLRANRVVVLTGVGGVGKTRLALRVANEMARDYADGVVVCDLVGAGHAASVVDVIATALEVLPSVRADPQNSVVDALRGQQVLLVLDNCEHVVDAVSELVERVCRRCPGVNVLATARRSLGVAGQQLWLVKPLAVDDGVGSPAVELFRDRAARADSTFEIADDDREAVVEICRRLDGLPLAIELAAAQVRSMNLADLASQLDHRFDMLATETGVSPRHRNLRAVFEWSFELLTDEAGMLLGRLATFAGGFRLDDAMSVCAGDGVPARSVAQRLTELVDRSLVEVDHADRYARYSLLESVRALAEEHLDERGELDVWRRRHGEHFVSLAEEAALGLRGPDEGDWVRTIDVEFANLRAVHGWASTSGQLDLALRLPGALYDYAYYRLHDEVHAWALRALALPDAQQHRLYPAAAVSGVLGRMQRGDLEAARDAVEQGLTTALGGRARLRALQLSAEIALYQGRLEDADERGGALVEHARSIAGADYDEALGHLYRVHAAAYSGRLDDARTHLAVGSRVAGRTGAPALRAGYLYLEGEIRLDDDPDAARAALHRAIELADSTRNRFVAGIARVSIAALEARHGDPVAALTAFREVVEHWRRCGDWIHVWTTLRNLTVLFENLSAYDAAAVLVGALRTATTGADAFGADAERLESTTAELRRALGAEAFAASEARGRMMTDADAVVFAVEELDHLLADIASQTT